MAEDRVAAQQAALMAKASAWKSLSGSPIKVYHTMTGAPNPQIVDLAAAELGIDLKSVIKGWTCRAARTATRSTSR